MKHWNKDITRRFWGRLQLKFTKMRLLASPAPSICLSVHPYAITCDPLNRFSLNFILESFLNFFDTFQFWFKSNNNNGHFT